MNTCHVTPRADLIHHEASEDCVCGPVCEPFERADGSMGWIYVHSSLDGRESPMASHRHMERDRERKEGKS